MKYLKKLFKHQINCVAYFTGMGDEEAYEIHCTWALRFYPLLLVGYTIFADTSKNSIHLHYVWGPAALTFLYNGLSNPTPPGKKKWSQVT
jgi:hypothetical protein